MRWERDWSEGARRGLGGRRRGRRPLRRERGEHVERAEGEVSTLIGTRPWVGSMDLQMFAFGYEISRICAQIGVFSHKYITVRFLLARAHKTHMSHTCTIHIGLGLSDRALPCSPPQGSGALDSLHQHRRAGRAAVVKNVKTKKGKSAAKYVKGVVEYQIVGIYDPLYVSRGAASPKEISRTCNLNAWISHICLSQGISCRYRGFAYLLPDPGDFAYYPTMDYGLGTTVYTADGARATAEGRSGLGEGVGRRGEVAGRCRSGPVVACAIQVA